MVSIQNLGLNFKNYHKTKKYKNRYNTLKTEQIGFV